MKSNDFPDQLVWPFLLQTTERRGGAKGRQWERKITSFPFLHKLSHVTDPTLGLSTHTHTHTQKEYKIAGTPQTIRRSISSTVCKLMTQLLDMCSCVPGKSTY